VKKYKHILVFIDSPIFLCRNANTKVTVYDDMDNKFSHFSAK